MLICIFVLLGWQSVATPPESDDIVVTATRDKDKCVVRYADREMNDAELDKRAASWKLGESVRLIARDVDFDCARKIATKLFARGVMRVIFVDPNGKPSRPFESKSKLPDYRVKGSLAPPDDQGGYLDTRAREHNFISRSAAGLIQQGKCGEARDFALREGDLDAAAAVAAICRAQDK
ncbi:hypothetical protein [Sphingomonas asaccharolytica]|uniref:hypothetical protein n=1 Tax=Sphingomonas asaccharolytica TaxID=40681 RepID=UPI0012ECC2AF|nr:hypothetical protein [Sphingomonas asaccharolytica]